MKITAEKELEFTCSICGASLDANFTRKWGNVSDDEIQIEPCQGCYKDKYDEGYEQGAKEYEQP